MVAGENERKQLQQVIDTVEKNKKKAKSPLLLFILLPVMMALLFKLRIHPVVVLLTAVAVIVFCAVFLGKRRKKFRREYRTQAIPFMADILYPGMRVNKKLTQKMILETKIPNFFAGDNVYNFLTLQKEYNGHTIYIYDFYTTETREDSDGHKYTVTVNEGMFIEMPGLLTPALDCRVSIAPEPYKSRNIVANATAKVLEAGFGLLSDTIANLSQNAAPKFEYVNLEDPVFEKYYQVKSNDQVKARMIMSLQYMEQLTSAYVHNHLRPRISYCGNDVTVYLPNTLLIPDQTFEGGKKDKHKMEVQHLLNHRAYFDKLDSMLQAILI